MSEKKIYESVELEINMTDDVVSTSDEWFPEIPFGVSEGLFDI